MNARLIEIEARKLEIRTQLEGDGEVNLPEIKEELEKLDQEVKEIEELEEVCTQMLVEKTKKSKKFWDKSIENDDFIFDAKEALKFGVISQILE
jgi:Zn-dependent M32 family carboxypeptidase